MKAQAYKILLAVFLWPLTSFNTGGLVGRAMPLLPATTLDGKTIDANYYKGHVTIVSFMFIGCLPCMNEISVLNRITDEYAGQGKVQVLCVARQMREQMIAFNSSERSVFNGIRKALEADSIRYAIQPACIDAKSTMIESGDSTSKNIHLKSECNTLEDVYGVASYPTNVLVDKNGIVRSFRTGGPPRKNDTVFYNELKQQIEQLLNE